MNKINLKHLRYFWVVAREGSVTKASSQLHLTPQTLALELEKSGYAEYGQAEASAA